MTTALACGAAAIAAVPQPADAASRRVEIASYRWTPMDVTIDLGERVTWHWTGPDLMHTVTGVGGQAAGIDSDPDQTAPTHELGHTFSRRFDQAGTYQFHCKIHTWVGGTVNVTSDPGDPGLDPDPIPPNRIDLLAPSNPNAYLASSSFGRGGTRLRFELDEPARAVVEIWRVSSRKRGSGSNRARRKSKERYVGYQEWGAHRGINDVHFGGRSKKFRARPGSYRAYLYLTDASGNESEPSRLSFRIRAPKRESSGRR